MDIQFEDVITTGSVAVFALFLAGTTAFAKLVWWLSDQFKQVRCFVQEWLQSHEDKDQRRHEDNIERFAKIETKLDTVIKNGHSIHN